MYSNPKKLAYKKPKQVKYIPGISGSTSLAYRSTALPGYTTIQPSNCKLCRVKHNTMREKFILAQQSENFYEEDFYSSGASGIPRFILQALYRTYSSSQNYYYVRDINNIISNKRIPCYIMFRDSQDFHNIGEDLLKRYYRLKEYPRKITQ
jgi:hypothetical protein